MKKIFLLGLLFITACATTNTGVVPTSVPSATLQATAEIKSLPTPVPNGQTISYKNLQVTMEQAEITTSYETEFGSDREPTAGIKFLWVHVNLKNVAAQEQTLPPEEHYSALLGETEFKPTYGYRKDHADYNALKPVLGSGEEVNAWLRFDIPFDAEIIDLKFVFMPDSTQVSFGFSSSEYSWADHPIYLWNCAP